MRYDFMIKLQSHPSDIQDYFHATSHRVCRTTLLKKISTGFSNICNVSKTQTAGLWKMFKHNEVNFEVTYEGHLNYYKLAT